MNWWKANHGVLLWLAAGMMLIGSRAVKADFTFGEPVNLGPIVNSNTPDQTVCISADGLSLRL